MFGIRETWPARLGLPMKAHIYPGRGHEARGPHTWVKDMLATRIRGHGRKSGKLKWNGLCSLDVVHVWPDAVFMLGFHSAAVGR